MNSQAASPEQLEHEIAQTRAAIDRKLTLLQRQLSPRRVARRAAVAAGEQGGTFVRNLGATLRDNPVPAVLLGVGICWLMLAGRAVGRRHDVTVRPGVSEASAPRAAVALAAAEAVRGHDSHPRAGGPVGLRPAADGY